MITKAVHGWRPAGLLAYLLGPGTAEVHRAPRVIASWDGLDAGWQPASMGSGEYDLALGPLIAALHGPVVAAGLPTRAPAEHGKRGYVWHCSARVTVWYTLHGHAPDDVAGHRIRARWYTTRTEPSYDDMTIKLRRVIIAARFRSPCPEQATPQETRAVLAAWAAAGT